MTKAVSVVIKQLNPKERNLFFRLLLLFKNEKPDRQSRDISNVYIDILALLNIR